MTIVGETMAAAAVAAEASAAGVAVGASSLSALGFTGTEIALAGTASSGWLSAMSGVASTVGSAATAVTPWLSGGMGLFSAFSTVQGARTQAAMYKSQGEWSDFQSRQEALKGLEDGNRMKKALIETMAAQNARWGAAGVDGSSGTPVAAQQEAVADADYQLGMNRDDAFNRALARRIAARQSRGEADAALMGGYGRAGATLMDLVNRNQARG